MSDRSPKLKAPPIVEAVLDIDCDLPPGFDVAALETAFRDAFRGRYPKFRTRYVQALQFEAPPDKDPTVTGKRGIQALQFLQADEKQLVQVRAQGFSFNRLAPYTNLDDYLPEMERTWMVFVGVAVPVQFRLVRLRYINRILLQLADGRVDLDAYLKLGPRLPDEEKLTLAGFLNQHSAVESDTGNQVNIILTAQPPENDKLPVILDIEAFKHADGEPNEWTAILSTIESLRTLKNLVFRKSLTDQCLQLFQR
ncbi:MAG: TIGR04255 family protein [Betaproteobacteria bacterium]|nr:TIGR04255 family protein [Betaproteobacteria bacterium]